MTGWSFLRERIHLLGITYGCVTPTYGRNEFSRGHISEKSLRLLLLRGKRQGGRKRNTLDPGNHGPCYDFYSSIILGLGTDGGSSSPDKRVLYRRAIRPGSRSDSSPVQPITTSSPCVSWVWIRTYVRGVSEQNPEYHLLYVSLIIPISPKCNFSRPM